MLVKAVSPQSLQLFPAMSVDGVTWTPRLQMSEQLTSGYRLGHFPLTPCLTQRQVSGISSFFRRHQGRCVVYGWGEDFCVCSVHSTSAASAEGLQLTPLLTLRADVF